MRRLLLLPLVLALAAPASAATKPDQYVLPGDQVFPEGIAVDGRTFYVGSTTDGTIFRGDVRTGAVEVLSPGGAGGRTTAVGIEALGDGRLLVAGGGLGEVFLVDARTGEQLGSQRAHGDGPFFLNDIAVSGGFAYVTNSLTNEVLRLPLDGGPIEPFAQPPDTVPGAFNANGIVATPDGYLIVINSATGNLFRISTTDGAVQQIDLGGERLTAGDGLELRGRTLWVVRNRFETVVAVKLDGRLRSGRVGEGVTTPAFKFPTLPRAWATGCSSSTRSSTAKGPARCSPSTWSRSARRVREGLLARG
jgi:Cu-Zn family superoxide dismutase